MRGEVTKRSVDALKPAADGAEPVLRDSELKGFGVRVQRGGAKSYVLHYRAGTGRGAPLRKLTIGGHGSPWTPETARREAKRHGFGRRLRAQALASAAAVRSGAAAPGARRRRSWWSKDAPGQARACTSQLAAGSTTPCGPS